MTPSAANPPTWPEFVDPTPWLRFADNQDPQAVLQAMQAQDPGERELALLLSPAARNLLEPMAQRAAALTRRHFGRIISLYSPLYVANYCSNGCSYCGFASDRKQRRAHLSLDQVRKELDAMRSWGCQEVLILTGERCPQADVDYLEACVRLAAERMPSVALEVFPMETAEYRRLAQAGATSVTMYQETYDPVVYDQCHRWGAKKNYSYRLEAPDRLLAAGMRSVGIGALLGLGEPKAEMISLFRHLRHLQRGHWKAGVALSFPRLRPQQGGFQPAHVVDDRQLAQIIWAFRTCLPTVALTLSTRESSAFRDGMAGVGISKMSVNSHTAVGGYTDQGETTKAQFDINDGRPTEEFLAMLRGKGLEPVFKNWDGVYREEPAAAPIGG